MATRSTSKLRNFSDQIACRLIKAGCSVNQPSISDGKSILELAINIFGMVQVLIESKADTSSSLPQWIPSVNEAIPNLIKQSAKQGKAA